MTPQEENARIQQQVNEELRAYAEAQRLATAETEKSAAAESKIAGLTTSTLQIMEKLMTAQLKYTVAMAKGKKGAAQFNDSIDAMTEATQIAAVALSLLVPGGPLIKGLVAGITFFATQAMKAAAEMQKAANEQADATYKAFQAFSKAGATGTDGLKGFFNDVNRMRLNVVELDAMAGVLAASAKEMASMGGTVYKARKEFADLVQGMGDYEQGMINLGLSYDEQAEAALGYMKLQSTISQGQQRDYGKLSGGMKKYLQETEALARVTGMNRKEQEAAQEKMLSQQRFGAKVQELRDNGQTEAAELLVSQMKKYAAKGEMYAQAFADSSTGMLTSEAAIKGNMSSMGRIMEDATGIAEGRIKTDEEANASFQETMGSVKDVTKSMNTLYQAGVGEEFLLPFKEAADITKAANQDFAKQIKEAAEEVKDLINSTDKVDDQLKRFGGLLKSQNDQMLALQRGLNGQFSTGTAGGGIMAFIDKLMKAFEPFIKMGMKLVEIFTPMVMGILDGLILALSGFIKLLTLDFIGAFGDFKGSIEAFADGTAETAQLLADEIRDLLTVMAGNLLKWFEFVTGPLGSMFQNLANDAKEGLGKFTDAMVDMVAKLWQKLSALIPDLSSVSRAAGGAVDYVSGAASSAGNYVSSFFGGGSSSASSTSGASNRSNASAPAGGSNRSNASAPAGGAPAGGAPAGQGDTGDMQRAANNAPPPSAKKGGSGAMDDAATKNMIARHEGIRFSPYKDSLGLWTVGVGHLIGDGKSLPDSWNRQFSKEEVMAIFDKDYEHHKAAAQSNTPNFDAMGGSMQSAFVDLAFNMGPNWTSKWPTLRKQLNAKDAAGAADNLANSKWAGQVGNRAGTIVGMVNSGFAKDGGVFDGPKSGYSMTLHGREAVIPLKDGAVPVSMSQEFNMTTTNLGELVNIMKNNVGMQTQMLAVLDEIRRAQTTTADNTSRMAAVASN